MRRNEEPNRIVFVVIISSSIALTAGDSEYASPRSRCGLNSVKKRERDRNQARRHGRDGWKQLLGDMAIGCLTSDDTGQSTIRMPNWTLNCSLDGWWLVARWWQISH
uniref:Secreted protein n=1 Tax=Panagrellus redivivus TaxID=6233 RepID=A0A7E4ZUT7_PANRE